MTNDEIARLVSGGQFPAACHTPKLVETHISWVILCDEYVFKIKKPAHYSFLDFSTVEKRKHYCEREVVLNKRLTSGVYLDVVPVRSTGTSIALGPATGNVIDHAVRMRKLDPDRQMDVLLRAGTVSDGQIRTLAEHIAAFHKTATIVYPGNAFDIREKFNDIGAEKDFLSAQLGEQAGALIVDAMERSDKFMEKNHDLLTTRVAEGFTRDVHGDLHSRNIFLLSQPVIFDCIEFNDEYRRVDILNEIAFLCMDLDALGNGALAKVLLDSYLAKFQILRNAREDRLFNYYKSYRANIRAKVNSLRARSASDPEAVAAAAKESSRYLALMTGYMDRAMDEAAAAR